MMRSRRPCVRPFVIAWLAAYAVPPAAALRAADGDGISTMCGGSMSLTTLTAAGSGTLTLSGRNSFLADQPAAQTREGQVP